MNEGQSENNNSKTKCETFNGDTPTGRTKWQQWLRDIQLIQQFCELTDKATGYWTKWVDGQPPKRYRYADFETSAQEDKKM